MLRLAKTSLKKVLSLKKSFPTAASVSLFCRDGYVPSFVMVEEISKICSKHSSNLSLHEEEKTILDLEEIELGLNDQKLSLILMRRLPTERSYNVEAFKRTTFNVWEPSHGLVIKTLSPNLYAFQFFYWWCMAKVAKKDAHGFW